MQEPNPEIIILPLNLPIKLLLFEVAYPIDHFSVEWVLVLFNFWQFGTNFDLTIFNICFATTGLSVQIPAGGDRCTMGGIDTRFAMQKDNYIIRTKQRT